MFFFDIWVNSDIPDFSPKEDPYITISEGTPENGFLMDPPEWDD